MAILHAIDVQSTLTMDITEASMAFTVSISPLTYLFQLRVILLLSWFIPYSMHCFLIQTASPLLNSVRARACLLPTHGVTNERRRHRKMST